MRSMKRAKPTTPSIKMRVNESTVRMSRVLKQKKSIAHILSSKLRINLLEMIEEPFKQLYAQARIPASRCSANGMHR